MFEVRTPDVISAPKDELTQVHRYADSICADTVVCIGRAENARAQKKRQPTPLK